MPQPTHRAQAVFRGTVQGVGFRYTTHRIASRHPNITGTVKNEADGSVTVAAEGTREQITDFLDELMHSMAGYISAHNVTWLSPAHTFHSFTIEH